MALRDALAALDGHGFHDTAHDRVRSLLACAECGHQPEEHEYDGGGACKALIGFPGRGYPCPCCEWECKTPPGDPSQTSTDVDAEPDASLVESSAQSAPSANPEKGAV